MVERPEQPAPAQLNFRHRPAAAWSSRTYIYDGTGNITKIGPAGFIYDKVNRLTAGNIYTDPQGGGTGIQQGYTFDPFGNLTAITGANARNTPTAAATNRLTSRTYDAAGINAIDEVLKKGGYAFVQGKLVLITPKR